MGFFERCAALFPNGDGDFSALFNPAFEDKPRSKISHYAAAGLWPALLSSHLRRLNP
jgi:hypothetical protein